MARRLPHVRGVEMGIVVGVALSLAIGSPGHAPAEQTAQFLNSKAPPPTFGFASLLDLYSAGEFASTVTVVAVAPDVAFLATAFQSEATEWIARAPDDAVRRRLVVASFILEAAVAREERDARGWRELADSVEWGCGQLRLSESPTPGEVMWNRAAAAAALRAGDKFWLLDDLGAAGRVPAAHLSHAEARLPDDPYLKLDRAVAETSVADNDLGARIRSHHPTDGGRARIEAGERTRTRAAIAVFAALVADPVVGADAEMRIAHLNYEIYDDTEAVARAEQAARMAPGRDIAYQADVLAGLALERLNRPSDAIRAYEAALLVLPGGQSATAALSARLALAGQFQRADDLVAQSLAQHTNDDDPWRLYPYGDYMRWDAIVRDLHRAFR